MAVLIGLEWATPAGAFTDSFGLAWRTPRVESSIALLKIGHELVEVPLLWKRDDGQLFDPITREVIA